MGFTDFFLDYIPMYAKFRTVASILVIAEFTIPLLAMLALKKIVEDPAILTKNMKALGASWLLTAGIALLFALMPSVFFSSFVSSSEMHALQNGIPQEYLGPTGDVHLRLLAFFLPDHHRNLPVVALSLQ